MTVSKAASNAVAPAAKGDLVIGSGTNASTVLGVASTAGWVLTADSSTTSGLKWAAASSSALTKIASGSFSNVATADIDSVFSGTYKNYMAILYTRAATLTDDLQLQMRYSTSTETGSNYFGSCFQYDRTNALQTAGYASATQATLCPNAGSTDERTILTIYFQRVGASFINPSFWGNGFNGSQAQTAFSFAGMANSTQTWTGFRLKSSSTNITGEYFVYGLAD